MTSFFSGFAKRLTLFITAACLCTAALAKPHEDSCPLELGDKPHFRISRVIRFWTRDEAIDAMGRTQAMMNARISPDYTTQQRVTVLFTFEGDSIYSGVLVPPDLSVNIGDTVEVERGHRDLHYPCNYVPPVIRRVVQHAS